MPVSFSWTIDGSPSSSIDPNTSAPGVASGADAERDWALDPIDRDLQIGADGDAVFNRGGAAIASDMQSEFELWLGEWYLDLQKGFPWPQEILGQPLDRSLLRRRVEEHALLVPGVTSVQKYELREDGEAREIEIEFEAVADTGQVIAATLSASEGSA